jgi:hypothetical protein
MNKKLNLTKLSKKTMKKAKAGVTSCLCGCPWPPDPANKMMYVSQNSPHGGH